MHVLALDVAGVFQTSAKCGLNRGRLSGGPGAQEPEDRHRRLLRVRRERPRRRAADERDELASLHVWMAPAWQEKM